MSLREGEAPRIVVVEDYRALSVAAADAIADAVRDKPDVSVVLATGNTPMGAYEELAARRRGGAVDASGLRLFQLDAYLGLRPDDPRSLYGWMHAAFIEPMGVSPANVVRLRGDTDDPEAECHRYDEAVAAAGGFDLAVLGLGPNGHLGFNEPPSDPSSRTRVVELSEESLESNASYWGGRERVPRRALTAGMEALVRARQILLLVSGERKREILRRTLECPPTPEVPASYLQRLPSVTVMADKAAWGARG